MFEGKGWEFTMGSAWVDIFGWNRLIQGYDMWIHLQVHENHNFESFRRHFTFNSGI